MSMSNNKKNDAEIYQKGSVIMRPTKMNVVTDATVDKLKIIIHGILIYENSILV